MSLFNLCFTGQLRDIEQCQHCGTTAHTSNDCPQRDEGEERVSIRLLHSLETVAAALSSKAGHFNPQRGQDFRKKRTVVSVTSTMSRTTITRGAGTVISVCYVEEIIPRHCATNCTSQRVKEVHGTEVENWDHMVRIRKQKEQQHKEMNRVTGMITKLIFLSCVLEVAK